jgi:hypothetical protein
MLWTVVVILLVLWLLGFTFHVGAGLIHILLVSRAGRRPDPALPGRRVV